MIDPIIMEEAYWAPLISGIMMGAVGPVEESSYIIAPMGTKKSSLPPLTKFSKLVVVNWDSWNNNES